ncbi:uncharacterized protein il17rb [Anableps anableps]
MWQSILFFLCFVASRVISHNIKVQCDETDELPKTANYGSPSKVAGLKLELVTVRDKRKLNISWAINIDASIIHLRGTLVDLPMSTYICKYNPSFTEANLTGLEKEWFHTLVDVTYGSYITSVRNLPLSPLGSGSHTLTESIWIFPLTSPLTPRTSKTTWVHPKTQEDDPTVIKDYSQLTTIVIVGVVASLIILSSFIVIYKMFSLYLSFEVLPVAPMTPVSVVVVYPAETPAFQQAVVALAEFLQWHGGCRVAIDMWQQRKIAELGPLRWLTEQVKGADRVLIISPQGETPSSMLGHSTITMSPPQHSIPAAAGDLYPLILNMVASHARSASELAKFWVVQLHANKDKKSCVLLPELQTCKVFCLMKDLNRLCMNLHAQRKMGKKISSLLLKPEFFYSPDSTAKLREAIETLRAKKPGLSNGILNKDLC